ncbi:hypothetical protein FIBSPDRAFT_863054 [Athelia psychrophila]|uniref:Uncharacterized protein n=1 Tax=Athelia psychrophila TaxID=1759441 RepID=A0A166HQY7_9AGAM|nr:hypothetical protein FIBSPDRAFT_863054 [Fibularhizoctonia sp. CBS 109695]
MATMKETTELRFTSDYCCSMAWVLCPSPSLTRNRCSSRVSRLSTRSSQESFGIPFSVS